MANRITNQLNAYESTLSVEMSSVASSMTLADVTGLDDPFYLVIEPDSPTQREYVYVSVLTGSVATVPERYLTGSAAGSGLTHPVGSVVRMVANSQIITDLNDRIDAVATVDATAIHDDAAAEISAITEKVTPVDADLVVIEDSAASDAKKRVQLGNLPSHTPAAHTVASHSDTTGTGPELDTLTDGSETTLHSHALAAHTVASHSDTTATGPELNTLTDGSDADALHAHPAIGGDVVFADLGPVAGSPLDISEVTDVTIVTTDIADVAVGDLVIARLWGTGLNNSGGSRTWTFTPDFDAVFDPEDAIGAVSDHATSRHYFYMEWTLAVIATNDARMTGLHVFAQVADSTGSWTDVTASNEQQAMWDRVTSDLTGTVTVSLAVRSDSATATQDFTVDGFVVRKISST